MFSLRTSVLYLLDLKYFWRIAGRAVGFLMEKASPVVVQLIVGLDSGSCLFYGEEVE